MSTNTIQSTVKPMRPWAATPRDRVITTFSIALAVLVSLIVVAVTPMKGKLAYAFVFYIAWLVIDSALVIRKSGMKGVRDGLAAKITLLGGMLVMMAVSSIQLERVEFSTPYLER